MLLSLPPVVLPQQPDVVSGLHELGVVLEEASHLFVLLRQQVHHLLVIRTVEMPFKRLHKGNQRMKSINLIGRKFLSAR